MLAPRLNKTQKDWTVLYYGGGTNNLQSSIKDAWANLEGQDLPGNVDTFVQHFDCEGRMQEAHFQGDGAQSVSQPTKESVNSGDPKVFQEFLLKGMKQFPASKYLVVVSSHGSGALGVVQDDVSGDNLSPQEVRSALNQAKEENQGKPVDVVLFDACQMASTEMAAGLSGVAGVMIASMDNVGRSGFHLPTLLKEASEHETAEQLSKALVHQDGQQQKSAFRTLSAINLDKVSLLTSSLDSWSNEVQKLKPSARKSLQDIARTCRRSINAPETQATFDSIADDLLAQYPVDAGLFEVWKSGTRPGYGASVVDVGQKLLADKELCADHPNLQKATKQLLRSHRDVLIQSRKDKDGHGGLTVHLPMSNVKGSIYRSGTETSPWEMAYNTIIPEGETLEFEPTSLEKDLAPFLPKPSSKPA